MDKESIYSCIDYIMEHLGDELSVGSVAEHFHYSEAHFNRCFKEATGTSVYEFILRLKMDQSAVDLKLRKDKLITDVGLEYGYSSTNFSTAFKKHHHQSPQRFRQTAHTSEMTSPFYPQGQSAFASFDEINERITIEELPDMPVVYERIVGSYADLKTRWPQFLAANSHLKKPSTRCIERFYDDPAVAAASSCIYDICLTADCADQSDSTTIIEGGAHAIYRFEGRIEDIFCAVQGAFNVWLPQSGYTMNRRYGLNIYRELNTDSPFVNFDLCIPVEPLE